MLDLLHNWNKWCIYSIYSRALKNCIICRQIFAIKSDFAVSVTVYPLAWHSGHSTNYPRNLRNLICPMVRTAAKDTAFMAMCTLDFFSRRKWWMNFLGPLSFSHWSLSVRSIFTCATMINVLNATLVKKRDCSRPCGGRFLCGSPHTREYIYKVLQGLLSKLSRPSMPISNKLTSKCLNTSIPCTVQYDV